MFWLADIVKFLDAHTGLAAWVQAIGAILIVGATARIANRNWRETEERERTANRQLRESITILARNCLDAIDTILKSCRATPEAQRDPRGTFLRSYVPSDFNIPMDGLAAIPLHQLSDAKLIAAVLTLRAVMGQFKKHLDDVLADPVLSQTLDPVRGLRTPAFNAVASVLRIVEGHVAEDELSRLAFRDNA